MLLRLSGEGQAPSPYSTPRKKNRKLKLFTTLKFQATTSIIAHEIMHSACNTGHKQMTMAGDEVVVLRAQFSNTDLCTECCK